MMMIIIIIIIIIISISISIIIAIIIIAIIIIIIQINSGKKDKRNYYPKAYVHLRKQSTIDNKNFFISLVRATRHKSNLFCPG